VTILARFINCDGPIVNVQRIVMRMFLGEDLFCRQMAMPENPSGQKAVFHAHPDVPRLFFANRRMLFLSLPNQSWVFTYSRTRLPSHLPVRAISHSVAAASTGGGLPQNTSPVASGETHRSIKYPPTINPTKYKHQPKLLGSASANPHWVVRSKTSKLRRFEEFPPRLA